MESRSDHIPGQAFQIDNSDLFSEKIMKLNYESHKNILDLSCKNRTKSPPINVTDLTHSSLASTTSDRHEESNNSDTERHSPYATVLMSPYSDTNSPKKGKLDDSTAVNNYSNMVVPSAMISPFIYPPSHLLPNSELTNDISKEMFSMSSPSSTSFMQASQSLPLGEATKIIPQTCSPIKMQSTVVFPQQMEVSQVRSARLESLKKVTRPFKAYPNDSVLYFNKDEHERYMMFREHLLQSVKKVNENPNPKMRRTSKSPTLPNSTVEEKDAAYWERRRKNNAAAKRSRDARRAKEDELAIRASYFEAENRILKSEIKYLRYICGLYNIDIDRKQS